MSSLINVLAEVNSWPPEQRLALAVRVLQSLQGDECGRSVTIERRHALEQLIGIWKSERAPSDDEVKEIIELERMGKYG